MLKIHRLKFVWLGLYLDFTLGRWDVSVSRARRSFLEFPRKRRTENGMHCIWGIFSLSIEDRLTECYAVCACCNSPEIGERFSGDEGWTVCEECGAVEQGYEYLNKIQYEALGY